MVRSSKGRQKVAMTKMSSESNLQVTFSKRRAGLFKKASELCTLCGAEVAIIVFSPGKKAFSFGHPNVNPIIDRFLQTPSPQSEPSLRAMQIVEANRNAAARELNAQLAQTQIQIEDEKKRGDALTRMASSGASEWWKAPVENLGLSELEMLKGALQGLKKSAAMEAQRRQMQIPEAITTTTTQMQSVCDGLTATTAFGAPNLGGMMDDGVGMIGMMMNPPQMFGFNHGNVFF